MMKNGHSAHLPGKLKPHFSGAAKACFLALLALFPASSKGLAQSVPAVDPERVDAFIELVALNECRITNRAAEIFLPAGGFEDRDEVRAIMVRLFYYGRARLVEASGDGALVLYDGPCPQGDENSDPRSLFLQIVAANGCSLRYSEGRETIEQAGLLKQEITAMLPLLQNDGTLTLSDDGDLVTMTDEACNDYGPDPELVTDLIHDPLTQPREALIEYLEVTGCELTYEDAQSELPDAGFDFAMIDRLVQDYIAEGIMEIGPNDTLILTIGACR